MKKREIVKSKIDFNNIIKKGKSISNKFFVIYYKENNLKHSRYGISVGTKLGNAVFRNKYKRKIRMIITENKSKISNIKYDYIVILRKSAEEVNYKVLETNLIELISKLKEN